MNAVGHRLYLQGQQRQQKIARVPPLLPGLVVRAEETLLGEIVEIPVDMVVLATAMVPTGDAWLAISLGAFVAFYAFVGFEMAAIPAGEMRNPQRDQPPGLMIGMGFIVTLYLLVQVVAIGTLPGLADSQRPLSDAAAQFLGPAGGGGAAESAELRLESDALAVESLMKDPILSDWDAGTVINEGVIDASGLEGGSIVLAAIMLKIGGYGFIRFSLPITPDASMALDWLIIGMSLIAVVYIGFVALVQQDMKKLIAYSSIAHMGFVTLGFFIAYSILRRTGGLDGAALGVSGGMVQMVSHGLVSGALFLCVGVLYDRVHSRNIADYGGVVNTMPKFAAFMVLFAMANAGPNTNGSQFFITLAAGWFMTRESTE